MTFNQLYKKLISDLHIAHDPMSYIKGGRLAFEDMELKALSITQLGYTVLTLWIGDISKMLQTLGLTYHLSFY